MSGATTLHSNHALRILGNMITVQVVAVVPAAHDAVTLLLALPGTNRAPSQYRPGQFITLAFTTTESTLYRSYSLCGEGRADIPWEITVKRQHAGLVSNYLYRNVAPGMLLQASLPQGRFTLPDTMRSEMPLVFVAGGSGITPIYGMLRALAQLAPQQRPRAWLHYAFHSPADAIYAQELSRLDPRRAMAHAALLQYSQWPTISTRAGAGHAGEPGCRCSLVCLWPRRSETEC